MTEKMGRMKQMNMTRAKIAGASLLFLKVFGVGKSLMFLAGGIAGFMLAHHLQQDEM